MEKRRAIDAYRQFNVAMSYCDTNALRKILAPTFTLTHMTGLVQSGNQWLAQIADGQMHYYSSQEECVSAVSVADGWQINGDNIVNAQIGGGSRQDWRLHTVMQVAEKAGQCQIMSAVVTPY
ncbi:nuclear transport factor 2 family protein [Furfurilactobacillus sp. WILCCON 0119]